MGKKDRNKRNRLQKQKIDSNLGSKWSIAILQFPKELDLELQRNEDIISSMHDDILSHVISFLPFESAVQTTFLSTRWKDLWKRNFPERKGTIDDAFAAISSLLHGCSDSYSDRQSTSNWGFKFNLGKLSFITVTAEPDKALHLDFTNVKHEFPWRFDWLLDISGPSYRTWLYHAPSALSVKVKTLHLKSISSTFSRAVSSMITNFKFLESLAVENCHGLRSLKLDSGANSRLKKVTILDCQQLESLHLDVYNLQSLRFRGKLLSFQRSYLNSVWIWPWFDDFHLEDAMLDFRQGPRCSKIGSCGFWSFFRGYKEVKSLTLSGWIFEPLIYPMLQSHGLKFDRLIELWWIDYAKERFNGDALMSFLKLCPRLTRLYITIDPKSYRRANTTANDLVEVASVSRLLDLKVVKLEGFPNEKEEIMLAKRLKREFHAEPVIIAKSNYLNCARVMVKAPVVKELQKEGEDSYKFIEARVEHLHDLCPKHLHMCI
ncbi:hypothetical protein HRI_002674100 [Hibiscus trionum]|uniref:F-box domain-containing protein n=1 Tax=Hibiscus trionum TaxID=183268 RepID=A0A9W7M6Q3_HIBTR|nr:hypothetical protein HRI_002674100 [Hibiscus trionum]